MTLPLDSQEKMDQLEEQLKNPQTLKSFVGYINRSLHMI